MAAKNVPGLWQNSPRRGGESGSDWFVELVSIRRCGVAGKVHIETVLRGTERRDVCRGHIHQEALQIGAVSQDRHVTRI